MARSLWTSAAAALLALALAGVAGVVRAGPAENAKAAFEAGDAKTALRLWTPLAEKGDPAAELGLSRLYLMGGDGVSADEKTSLDWARKAAAQGYAPAKGWLLIFCMNGDKAVASYCPGAVADLKRRADGGEARAQAALGSLYLLGRAGQPRDPDQALVWLRKAAGQDYVLAETQLALMYGLGTLGAPKDDGQSLFWRRKAAEQGDAGSMDALALDYQIGASGLTADPAQALAWYRKAADKGDVMALTTLARMYDQGQDGVTRDPQQALHWYRELAEQGDAGAAAWLDAAYAKGEALTRDDVQAYAWLDAAVREGRSPGSDSLDDRVLARDAIGARLTPAELAEARRRSAALEAKADAKQKQTLEALGKAFLGEAAAK